VFVSSWSTLTSHFNFFQDTTLQFSDDELHDANRMGIPLNDEKGGYLATIDVFVELHFLNVIREQVYRPYYHTKHSIEEQLMHVDHCIDTLRQTLVCHGDDAILSYSWKPNYQWPWPSFTIDHECRNWDTLLNWAAERRILNVKGPILTHPTLGNLCTRRLSIRLSLK